MLGSLIGDPARANMLTALMAGKALTASELAGEAGITLPTASTHLKKLESADLLRQRKQGRHRYFTLADDDVAQVLETLMGMAARRGLIRTRTGPRDPALRRARVCYNHLAGDLGVQMFDSLLSRNLVVEDAIAETVTLTDSGREFMINFDIDLPPLEGARRPVCRPCLDWSARRTHLAGALGTAIMDRMTELGWARRQQNSRIVTFTPKGEKAFQVQFPAR